MKQNVASRSSLALLNALSVLVIVGAAGCATATIAPPTWSPTSESAEVEYQRYHPTGTGSVHGQAFLTKAGGAVVTAAGRTVTLDPATTIGDEWWNKAGKVWVFRDMTHPSPSFLKNRRVTTADAEGRFRFSSLPAGRYYLRTEVTWEVGGSIPTQGGLVGTTVEVKDATATEVIVNQYPK